MMMFLSIFAAGMLVVFVCAAIVSSAGNSRPVPPPALHLEPSRFFAAEQARPRVDEAPVPIEVVLSQIERHVRLEQLVAERYLSMPTPDALRTRSDSPFVN